MPASAPVVGMWRPRSVSGFHMPFSGFLNGISGFHMESPVFTSWHGFHMKSLVSSVTWNVELETCFADFILLCSIVAHCTGHQRSPMLVIVIPTLPINVAGYPEIYLTIQRMPVIAGFAAQIAGIEQGDINCNGLWNRLLRERISAIIQSLLNPSLSWTR